MRIGCFVSSFISKNEEIEIYGADMAAYHLCYNLAHRGHYIDVFVPFKKDSVERYNNLIIHFYDSFLKFGTMNISYKLFFEMTNYNVDLVCVHNDTPLSVVAGMRYVKKKKIPLVVYWHGDWIGNYGGLLRRTMVHFSNVYLVSKILNHSNIIVSPSRYYINESRFLGQYRDKIVIIPNGINIEDFDIPYSRAECRKMLGLNDGENIVLFLSALYSLKGPHILLKAIPKIIKEHKDTIFVFVGGEDVYRYKKLSEEIGVQKYVRFTGYVKESLKPLYYNAANIFVLPSIETFEVFPLVLLEASASGLPMVVSDLNTLRCIIEDGYNGIITKRGDERNLAEAIIYLLANEDVREKMGDNARNKVKDYSWDKIAEMTERAYEAVLR